MKFLCKQVKPKIAKIKDKREGIALPDFILYYKAILRDSYETLKPI